MLQKIKLWGLNKAIRFIYWLYMLYNRIFWKFHKTALFNIILDKFDDLLFDRLVYCAEKIEFGRLINEYEKRN